VGEVACGLPLFGVGGKLALDERADAGAQRLVLGSEDRRPDFGCNHVLAVQRDLQPVEAAEVDPAVPDWIALLLERGEPLHERADRDLPFDARKGGTEAVMGAAAE